MRYSVVLLGMRTLFLNHSVVGLGVPSALQVNVRFVFSNITGLGISSDLSIVGGTLKKRNIVQI